MQRVERVRIPLLVVAALLVLAAASLTTARFAADRPGGDLNPIETAAEAISLIQGNEHLLWVSLAGPVTQVTVWGWPVSDGEIELGGGMSLTRLEGETTSGIIDTGEKPRAVSFELTD
jgi:hypothetical protein